MNDWKEILRNARQEKAEIRRSAEINAGEPTRKDSLADILEVVGAQQMLEEVRRDVWEVGEVRFTENWYLPGGNVSNTIYSGLGTKERAKGWELVFPYRYLALASDSAPSYTTGSGDTYEVHYPETNFRAEVKTTAKKLAIVTVREASSGIVLIDSRNCAFLRHKLITVAKYDEHDRISWLQDNTDVQAKFGELFRGAVIGCYVRNDLPLQLQKENERKIAECRHNGGIRSSNGFWYKWKG